MLLLLGPRQQLLRTLAVVLALQCLAVEPACLVIELACTGRWWVGSHSLPPGRSAPPSPRATGRVAD